MVDIGTVGRSIFSASSSGNNITNAEQTGGTREGPLAQTQASRPLASTQDVFEKSATSLGEGSGTKPYHTVDATTKNGPSERSAVNYDAVIDQFKVETNPRYKKNQDNKGETYCNVFVSDVTKAMGAEIPHWQDKDGNPVDVPNNSAQKNAGATEITANGMCDWLEKHGAKHGWTKVTTATEAQAAANEGKPTVAAWKSTSGPGHVGMVRPGEADASKGPALAQAGNENFENVHVGDGFGNRPVTYWVHNPPVAAQ